MQQGVERTPLPLNVESSFEESFGLVSPFRNDELNGGKSFFGDDSNVGRSDWDKFQSLPSPFEFGIDLDMEQEFFKSDVNVDSKVVGPTLAELNDHRSLSPLINPEMERLHRIATRTDESSSSSAVTSRKPQSYIALEYSEEKTDIPVIQVKREPSKSNGECNEGFGNNVGVLKGTVERKFSSSEPSWTVTQSIWRGINGTGKEIVSNDEERSGREGKLASDTMTKVPTLISAQMRSQIYTDDHEDRSSKKEEIATNQNATATDPASPAVDDESADEEMDSDEDFEVENLSQEAGLMRHRKGRRGEVDDLSPNPRKLLEISRELHRLNKVIGDLKPINKLPQNARNKSRKEKNKLASRACRLKKKAQHEANKVKLHGLEMEQQRLTEVIDKVKKEILKGSCMPIIQEGSLSSQVEELIKATFGNQLVAGHTSDFVHSVLKATARSTPALEGLDGLSMCF